jgi:hypothetical protein
VVGNDQIERGPSDAFGGLLAFDDLERLDARGVQGNLDRDLDADRNVAAWKGEGKIEDEVRDQEREQQQYSELAQVGLQKAKHRMIPRKDYSISAQFQNNTMHSKPMVWFFSVWSRDGVVVGFIRCR